MRLKPAKFFMSIILFILFIGSLPFLIKKKGSTKEIEDTLDQLKISNTDDIYVKLIDQSDEALESRIALIDQADATIFVSYYHIDSYSETSQIFLGALIQAANRGIQVHIVVDAKFGGIDKNMRQFLSQTKGITLYHYNPVNFLKPESLLVSLHNKLLIIDDTYILSGGRNISDAFLKEAQNNNGHSHDLDLLIKTTADAAMMKSSLSLFHQLVDCQYTVKKRGRITRKTPILQKQLQKKYESYHYRKDYLKAIKKDYIKVDNVLLLSSAVVPTNKNAYIAEVMLQLSCQIEGDVTMQSPYIVGNKRILQALARLSSIKDVRIFTNSLASSPNFLAFSNYLFHRKKIVQNVSQVYEYFPKDHTSVHSKAYVLGRNITAIGSMNLDNRSLAINSEQMLLIESEDFQNKYFETLKKQALASKLVSKDLRQYKKTYEKEIPRHKKIIMYVFAYVLRPFQNLL